MSVGQDLNRAEELTLADAIRILVARRKVVVGVLLAGILGSVALTVAAEPQYEARASFLVLNEKDTVLALLRSESYAASVATSTGSESAEPAVAGRAVLARIEIQAGARTDPANLVVVRATGPTAESAAALADAYVTNLDAWRPYLEGVTRNTLWAKYFEQSGKDAAKAEAQLQNLTREMRYHEPLDRATAPASPESPDWKLNLAIGGALGGMGGIVAPFVLLAVEDALRTRRAPRGADADEIPDRVP